MKQAFPDDKGVEVVLIDADVQDAASLVKSLRTQAFPLRKLDAYLIASDEDGVAQIARILEPYRRRIAVLHLISHGTDGALKLGSSFLSHQSFGTQSRALSAWRSALRPEAEILLYGCQVAATTHGQRFVRRIKRLTGSEVMASMDATGASESGGNWALEFQTAPMRSTLVLSPETRQAWRGTLPMVPSGSKVVINNPTSGTQVTTTRRQAGVDASGNYVALWQGSSGVKAQILKQDGTVKVSTITPSTVTDGMAQVAMNASGQFVVVWVTSSAIKAQRFNANGTTSGSEITVATGSTTTLPSVAMNDAGNFAVSWSRHAFDNAYNYYKELYLAVYSWSATIKSGFMVSDGWQNYASSNTDISSSVAMDSSGNIALVADHGGAFGATSREHIWLWTLDAAGNIRTGRTRINPADNYYRRNLSVAMDDNGNIVVVWTWFNGFGWTDIYSAQALFSTGGSANFVGQGVSNESSATSSDNASVTINKHTGVYTVAYETASRIHIRQFAIDGSELMSETRVDSTNNAQSEPSIARHGIYTTVIWTAPGDGDDVWSQRYVDPGPDHFELTTPASSVASGSAVNLTLKACSNSTGTCTLYKDGATGAFSITGTNVTTSTPAFTLLSGATGSASLSATVTASATTTALFALSSSSPTATGTPKLWCGFGGATPTSASSCAMPVVNGPHHLNVTASSASSLTCSNPITFMVTACANASCSSLYTNGVTGNLTLTGAPTVNFPSGNAFTIANGSSSTTVQAHVTTTGTVTAGTSSVSPAASHSPATYCGLGTIAASGNSCVLSVDDSGLLLSAVPHHVSNVSQALTVSAVKASDNSTACTPAFASVTKAVNFTCSYLNPNSGTLPVRVGGSALNAAGSDSVACDAGGRSVNLNFNASGVASTTLAYADVGRVTVNARHTGSGSDVGLILTGASTFIAAPASFAFSAFPLSASEKVVAGAPFSATVSARNHSGDTTPNFGRESTPESVTLSWTKAAPTGGGASSGIFSRTAGTLVLSPFSSGAATASDLKWSEVGTGDLAAALTSGSYLSSGVAAASGNTGSAGAVGRFIPHRFDTAVTQGCGAFTYSGQPFGVVVTARNADGGVTVNYNGTGSTSPGYAKAVALNAATNGATGSLMGAEIPDSAFGAGSNTSNPSSSRFTFTEKLTTPTLVKIRATDADGVSSASGSEGSVALRSGRLRLSNAFGSEKAHLDMPVQAQYWSGRAWLLNALDSCTSMPSASVALSNTLDHKGHPTAWTTLPSAIAIQGGNGVLCLGAPSGIRSGTVDVAVNLGSLAADASCLANHPISTPAHQDWLRAQYGSSNACAGDNVNSQRDPSARATFGIFSPESKKLIFIREMF